MSTATNTTTLLIKSVGTGYDTWIYYFIYKLVTKGNDTIIIVIIVIVIIVIIVIIADFFSYLCVFESHLLGF